MYCSTFPFLKPSWYLRYKILLFFQRLFGMIRNACGSNSHPDPLKFSQMYRLLSVYSLVQPPRGSNITGGEVLETLLDKKDINEIDENTPMKTFMSKLDGIVEKGVNIDELQHFRTSADKDHNYVMTQTGDFAIAYVSGYVVRRSETFTTCHECLGTLQNATESPCPKRDLVIDLKSRGGLLHPSDLMFNLCSCLEQNIMTVVSSEAINRNILFEIVDMLELVNVPKVGCAEHRHFLTARIIKFYLIMRMNFIANKYNDVHLLKREKTKLLQKQSKLI